jgi:hypothetical protein
MVETAPTTAAESLAIFRQAIRLYDVLTHRFKEFLIISDDTCGTARQSRFRSRLQLIVYVLFEFFAARVYRRKSLFVTGRVPGCDGFCDGSAFCKFFSINECDGVTAPDPWKASTRARFSI